jgi:hypothetical protein
MSNRHYIRRTALAITLVWATLGTAQDRQVKKADDDFEVRYEVRGKSTRDNHDRPWSDSFSSKSDAAAQKEKIKLSHGPGGLLEKDPEKPTDLYVHEFKVKRLKPSGKSTEGQTEAPAAGTKYRITVIRKDKDKTVELTDKGKTFENYAAALQYMNQQNTDPDLRATIRTLDGGTGLPIAMPNLKTVDLAAAPKPESIAGKWQKSQDDRLVWDFKEDGTVIWITAQETKVFANWTQKADKVTIKYLSTGAGGYFTLKGDRLTETWGDGNVGQIFIRIETKK